MDDKQPKQQTDEDSSGSVDIADDIKKAYAYIEIIQNKLSGFKNTQDGAGPSTAVLPGTIQSPKKYITKPGQSKSKHNIRHIITTNDVENALKLTSLSFSPVQLEDKNINFKDIQIPYSLKEHAKDELKDPKAFAEIKDLMVACIKKRGLNLTEVSNVQNVNSARNIILAPVHEPTVTANVLTTSDVQTDTLPPVPLQVNEVLVTGLVSHADLKIPRTSEITNKKKTSGSLSERTDFPVTHCNSLSSIGSNVCRICMTRGRERLISPCNCKGSMANVHLSCLERWLNQVGRNHCELCGFRNTTDMACEQCQQLTQRMRIPYPAIRTPRYTVLQALRLWFGNPRNRSHLQSDCLIFWLLSTVTAGLLAVCIVGTQYFVIEGTKFGKTSPIKEEGISHRITETAMDFFMAIVLCGYTVTVYLLWKDHYVMWNRWRRANVNVRLLLTPDAIPVPFVPRPQYNIV